MINELVIASWSNMDEYLFMIFILGRYIYGYALIGNPDNPAVTSTDHGYFGIHDDLFDIILEN